MLYVADSVGHSVNLRIAEKINNCRIKSAKAYSSVFDRQARWPNNNLKDVVKHNLDNPGREPFEMLVTSHLKLLALNVLLVLNLMYFLLTPFHLHVTLLNYIGSIVL